MSGHRWPEHSSIPGYLCVPFDFFEVARGVAVCVYIYLCTVDAQKCNDYEYIPVYTTRTLALKKKKCLCVRAADLEPPAGRGAHVRAGAPFNARCVIARCVIARCVIALRALFTARCVILLRRTGSALPLRTRRAPSGLRSSRRALHADTLFFL